MAAGVEVFKEGVGGWWCRNSEVETAMFPLP